MRLMKEKADKCTKFCKYGKKMHETVMDELDRTIAISLQVDDSLTNSQLAEITFDPKGRCGPIRQDNTPAIQSDWVLNAITGEYEDDADDVLSLITNILWSKKLEPSNNSIEKNCELLTQ